MRASPQLLGACAGALVMAGIVLWQRLRPPPCTGGVFIELRPPLQEAGPYRFRLLLDGGPEVCEFELSLPLGNASDKKNCRRAIKLDTRVEAGLTSLTGVTIGASPETLGFQVKRGADTIYDTELTLRYSPYEIRREDEKRFCGERALAQPVCRRGSPECGPFGASCDGPEDCPSGRACCANPEQARQYGPKAATECRYRRSCLDGFGRVVCHTDADCPNGMKCDDSSLASAFTLALWACREDPRK